MNNYLYYIDYLSIIQKLIIDVTNSKTIENKLKYLVQIKKKIIFLIQSVGMNNIYDIIDLFIKKNDIIKGDECIKFYNMTFQPYIVKYEKLHKKNSQFLFNQTLDNLSEHIFIKTNGLIITIEYIDIKLVIQGYFNMDNYHLYRNHRYI